VHTYFIAAEEVDWDYAPSGRDDMMGHAFMDEARIFVERENGRIGRMHRKAIYVEYTGPDFNVRKPRAAEWEHRCRRGIGWNIVRGGLRRTSA
jgi:hephaestin